MFNFFSHHTVRKGVELHPEEIFMDAHNAPGFSRESAEGVILHAISDKPFFIFFAVLFAGLIALAGKLAYLEVAHGRDYAKRSEQNQFFVVQSPAERGIVYDRNRKPVAVNEPAFSLVFRKKSVADSSEIKTVLESLARFAHKSLDEVLAENGVLPAREFDPASLPQEVIVAEGLNRDDALEFQSQSDFFPGAELAQDFLRAYPYGPSLTSVLGYVGRDLSGGDTQINIMAGKAGIELYYDRELRGVLGKKAIEINAKGQFQEEHASEDGKSGNALMLNIDAELQDFAYRAFQDHLLQAGKRAGAIVISDPRDGSILAFVSFPTVDGNLFKKGMSQNAFQKLANDPAFPFLNRAISALYPAGSTIKPMLASAALEENIIDPARKIFDEGFISIPNPYKPGEQSIFKDWKALGWVDMRRAIAYSANVYFYTIGGGYRDIQGLGVSRIKKYLSLFGFGENSGIDVPGEKAGVIPDQDWKAIKHPEDPIWRLGDTYHISIGQGDMRVTALQINMATAAIANWGTLFEPRIAKTVLDESGNVVAEFAPRVRRANFVSRDDLKIVREGMRMAVVEGSASALSSVAPPVAGKTGTAETGRVKGETHAWFTGFAPYDNPEIAVTVFVERGGEGSLMAVPIARDILSWWAENRYQKAGIAQ
ncbi:penicillin-binding protein 2 [Patescibacteria group bacterium]|nr:penicillin-binding protein 2 [Patescibacteria group bacterium]